MTTIVYRHADKFAIIKLLKEIGEHRLQRECRLKHLPKPRRVRLFFIEAFENRTYLKYKYHDGTKMVMPIDGFDIPEIGWTRVEIK